MPTAKKTPVAKKTSAPKKVAAPKTEKVEKAEVAAVRAQSSMDSVSASDSKSKSSKPSKASIPTPTGEFFYAAGNRKTSVARVRLYKNGTGAIIVNGKKLEDYITLPAMRDSVKAPLRITGQSKTFDISAKTSGGGLSGQADAIRHGISKALLEFDPSLRITLKRAGFLTRDPRMKERKKPGLHRARRAPQWSKR